MIDSAFNPKSKEIPISNLQGFCFFYLIFVFPCPNRGKEMQLAFKRCWMCCFGFHPRKNVALKNCFAHRKVR